MMILGRMKTQENINKKTLYEFANSKGITSTQIDEGFYRLCRGLSVAEPTLKVITEYIAEYIMIMINQKENN